MTNYLIICLASALLRLTVLKCDRLSLQSVRRDMGEDPGYRRAVSLHLARVLDEIGLNALTVKRRRHACLCREQMLSVQNRITGANVTNYHFGSQTEGATTPGMDSDLDTLNCLDELNVIDNLVGWQKGEMNLLMLHEDTAPGYCRLQLLRSDVPMAWEDLATEDFTYDSSGRAILKNTWIHLVLDKKFPDRSGPAASRGGEPGFIDQDYVIAIHCSTWPEQAAEFTRRRRLHGWPSQRLLKEAVSHGIFLVPVGHKLSPTETLEWRISASLAERCLMFSLTNVHIKCFAVLKILVKTFITPLIKDSISSYHCKTALLHCTETTENGFWRDDNMLLCVTRCLEFLRNCVTDLVCPQFMISEANLFAGKVTIHNRDLLLCILTKLIKSDGRALLQVKMDDLGHKLQTQLNTEPSCVPIVDSAASVELAGQFELGTQRHISYMMLSLIVHLEHHVNETPLISSVYQHISLMKGTVPQANRHERQVLQTFIPLLSCWLGSLLASFALSHSRRVPRQGIQLMTTAVKYDVASMLKLASVFYCSGRFGKAETMLQIVDVRLRRNDMYMYVVCVCYDNVSRLPPEFCCMMHVLKGKKSRAKLVAHCVRFSAHEFHCAPPALRHELHRSVGDDLQHRDPSQNRRMILAAVDCLPYLYYLQYLTYKQLGKHGLQRRSLRNLDRCVREDHDFCHLETAWNLLGQCQEDEQYPGAAMACYRASLEIRFRNNAANWHVAILWYKLIKNRGLLQGVAEDKTEK